MESNTRPQALKGFEKKLKASAGFIAYAILAGLTIVMLIKTQHTG